MSGVPEAGAVRQPPAVLAGRVLVAELLAHGVRDVVLCPGSRSAPLAYALADAEVRGEVRLHVRVDERSAGFLALGLAKGAALAGEPAAVAVVTTSGTATANLHPAVLEAHHGGVPLVVVTADRPHELRGTGANQTTDQVGLYGSAVRHAVDVPAPDGRPGEERDLRAVLARALTAALGTRTGDPGPVHLDVAYRDPLVPVPQDAASGEAPVSPAGRPVVVPARPVVEVPDDVAHLVRTGADEPATVLVAGDGAGPWVRELSAARGWPLLAEPSSGAAGGPDHVAAYRLLLGTALGGRVARAVVVGRPTLSRPVQTLLGRPDVTVVVVAPGGAPWPDAARGADLVLPGPPDVWLAGARGPEAWLREWRDAGARAAEAVRREAARALGGPAVAEDVLAACGADQVLVVGSSTPVRDLDLAVGTGPVPPVVANRGLAGIDGTVSTASGVALGAGRPVLALMGDLTFLHDVGGLLRGPDEPVPDLRVVVVDDDGGSIFATLEQGGVAQGSQGAARTFERVFATPHGADLAALCAGYGVAHLRVGDREELRRALARPVRGVDVVSVPVRRDDRRALGERLRAAVGDS
ncbi:2-succinyl-5-enolpyruvyl-6-hydroxy-3-cyclohexene-1-carboxylic-acid synthase [Cellulomonas sp. PhB143]|uniref:2-succinyl-5-enolpyruvyl-6-hydroxy-3- cyclohexene-1-carboxylic-acid synthase n=1 Tax=Cellulomonas sp. PhB143 TaxID=2485186 RepID=UPI000FBE3B9F|nr:2-succinyl-5-enolpyruvyl-6-hydroxy-3-cyclohexene-1-carboxylic-acid synthase [Cellulomonas sp. PhB143]ROS76702.1 2-succinyl-5-enolpyruvyl-6-hydroxy-3-cyclohexene-1-carboxylate synthase [Cellulomonas sp. PhB143]